MEPKTPTSNSKVEEAIRLWMDLTDVDPNAKKIYIKDMDVYFANREIKESLTLDPEGLTFLGLMYKFSQDFFKSRHFSLDQLMQHPEETATMVNKAKELKAVLNDPEVVGAYQDFRSHIEMVMRKIGVDRDEVYEKLKDSQWLAEMRRDALKSEKLLHVYQFLWGEQESQNAMLSDNIHIFDNINSLIRVLTSQASGVSLNIVRDTLSTETFFVIAVKNGGNLTILTDRPEQTHPMQKYMTRRHDRDYGERISKHHFPYGLAEQVIKLPWKPSSKGLVPINTHMNIVGQIHNLPADEIVWLVILLALVDKKFFKENYHTEALSYTSDMIVDQEPGLEMSRVPMVIGYHPLSIPQNTLDSIADDAQYCDSDKDRPNRWMEERYKDKVSPSLLNGLARGDEKLFLPTESNAGVIALSTKKYEEMGYFEKRDFDKTHADLWKMDGSFFGTAEQLERDYRWMARYNEAAAINILARQEYEERLSEVKKWATEHIQKNLGILIEKFSREILSENIRTQVWPINESDLNVPLPMAGLFFLQGKCWSIAASKCYFTGKAASYKVFFTPRNVDGLKELTGTDDIPDVLEFWDPKDDFGWGNPILERLDPMNWVPKNPWKEMSFITEVYISKTYWNGIQKKFKLNSNHLLSQKR